MANRLSPLDEAVLSVIESDGNRLSVDRLFHLMTEKPGYRKLSKKNLRISLQKLNRRGKIRIEGKMVYFVKL